VLKQQSIAIKSIRYDSGKKLACWPCETMKFSNVGQMRLNRQKQANHMLSCHKSKNVVCIYIPSGCVIIIGLILLELLESDY